MLNLQTNNPIYDHEPQEPQHIEPSIVHGDDGSEFPVDFDTSNFKAIYRDEYTGEVLPYHLVRAAMAEEMTYFNRVVWQATDHSTAKHTADFKLVRTRWVITNKGDAEAPDVRARLVACEINDGKTDAYFASTPPLEAKRILFSEYASRRWSKQGDPLMLSFVDIKKAYFNATPKRNVHLQFPKELGAPQGKIAHLLRCCYGTRDAGLLWEDTYAACLESMGFKRGVANPCCFYLEDRDLAVVVHGDDVSALGRRQDLDWYHKKLAASFEIKIRAVLGEGPGCDTEVRILNRILRLTEDGLLYESDPRHVEMLLRSLEISSNDVCTPGDKNIAVDADAVLDEPGIPEKTEIDIDTNDFTNDAVYHVRVRAVHFNDDIDMHNNAADLEQDSINSTVST